MHDYRSPIHARLQQARVKAAFSPCYREGDEVHLVGDHPWNGARGVILGYEWMHTRRRVMYTVELNREHRKYVGHVCFAHETQLLPAPDEKEPE